MTALDLIERLMRLKADPEMEVLIWSNGSGSRLDDIEEVRIEDNSETGLIVAIEQRNRL